MAQKQTHRSIEQNSTEMNPHLYGQLIYDKGGKNVQWGKDNLFNKWCWENQTATCKRIILDYFLTPCTKINSKQIKDIKIKLNRLKIVSQTIKLLQENIGSMLFDIDLSNIFLVMSPLAKGTKAKINKWDYITLESFHTVKETINKQKTPNGLKT